MQSTYKFSGAVPSQTHRVYNFSPNIYTRELAYKTYELTDHLGNVRVTISDVKEPNNITNLSLGYHPQIKSAIDNYPFGWGLVGRDYNSNSYRFGYNSGSEKDDEITGVTGSHYTTYFRELDTRVVRWWSVDPKAVPWESPYVSMANNPLFFNDKLGDTVDPTKLKNEDSETYDKTKSDIETKTGYKLNETPNAYNFNSNPVSGELTITPDEDAGFHWTVDKEAGVKTDDNGNPVGSDEARNLLTQAIGDKRTVYLEKVKEGKKGSYYNGESTIFIDGGQINSLMKNMQGTLAPSTTGYALATFHETDHWLRKTNHSNHSHTNIINDKTIIRMNTIRSQLGTNFGQRTAYWFGTRKPGMLQFIPFDEATRKAFKKGDQEYIYFNGNFTIYKR